MRRGAPYMKGDPVWYQQTARGGYGVDRLYIPARWLGQSMHRVIVELSPPAPKRILHVSPSNVTRRDVDQTVHPTEKERHA